MVAPTGRPVVGVSGMWDIYHGLYSFCLRWGVNIRIYITCSFSVFEVGESASSSLMPFMWQNLRIYRVRRQVTIVANSC
jgi:hypothetical protein